MQNEIGKERNKDTERKRKKETDREKEKETEKQIYKKKEEENKTIDIKTYLEIERNSGKKLM